MTPRIKEPEAKSDLSWFSSELLSQKKQSPPFHLKGDALFDLLHPALIKCRYLFEHQPQDLFFTPTSGVWNLTAFKNQQECDKNYSGMKSYGGLPWQIFQFLQDSPTEAILHFQQLGSIYLSKSQTAPHPNQLELHHYILPIWLDYALSSEIWGPAGKWTRFHARLHTLFANNGLLIEQDFPGFYPLTKETQWLKQHGFDGKLTNKSYDLILGWDFPLSGLIELEKVLARGP